MARRATGPLRQPTPHPSGATPPNLPAELVPNHVAIVMDGNALRDEVVAGLKETIEAAGGPEICLATVLVGDDPASATYVRMTRKACEEAGIASFHKEMPETATEEEVLKVVSDFNRNPSCHGEEDVR